jgi:pimeloyl-ACP methyl ester carboxylesterase
MTRGRTSAANQRVARPRIVAVATRSTDARAAMKWLFSTLLGLLVACASGPLEDPIPTATHPKSEQGRARALVIMLPGAGDRLGVYDERGFVAAMRESGMDVDMLEVDAHYGYYRSRTLMERMGQDVLAPNRDAYDEIWIVGLSMGGIGALLTAWTYPEDIDGLVLIAPYLGRRKTLQQIRDAGGLTEWQPPTQKGEWDLEIWRMLKQICESGAEAKPELWLMYGVDDFGVEAHQLLAAALPAERVETTSGGHAWPTWTQLWATLMAERPFK